MIVVRNYDPSDEAEVKELHKIQGLSYELPDLDRMLVRVVVERDSKITHAAFLRRTAEAYWLFNPNEDKRTRAGNLLLLHREVNTLAQRASFNDVHCWIPQEIAKDFEKTLFRLNWEKPLWTCYHREVG